MNRDTGNKLRYVSAGCWLGAGVWIVLIASARILSQVTDVDAFYEINSALTLISINQYTPWSFFISSDAVREIIWRIGSETFFTLIPIAILLIGAACAAKGALRLAAQLRRNPQLPGPAGGSNATVLGFVLGALAFAFFIIPGVFALLAAIVDRTRRSGAPNEEKRENGNSLVQIYKQFWTCGIRFAGRTRRRDYWLSLIMNFIVLFFCAALDLLIEMPIFSVILTLAMIVPGIAISVRRLHDIGKSGWWYLIILAPLVGGIVMLIFTCIESEAGENMYGANPKGNAGTHVPGTAAAASKTASSSASLYDAIGKLGELRDKGLLTEEEFTREKAKLL
jgi:uncharacterized membrane protein YhaH (DUF805 family)